MDRLGSIIDRLGRTPGTLASLLGEVPHETATHRTKPRAFSPYHVVAHLIIGEQTDWIPRVKHTLEHGTRVGFTPFAHSSTIEPSDGPGLETLLARFHELRTEGLEELRVLATSDEILSLNGRHPEFGVVTIGQLLSAWCVHDLHHTAQICKGLAGAQRRAVGPWSAYLGILDEG